MATTKVRRVRLPQSIQVSYQNIGITVGETKGEDKDEVLLGYYDPDNHRIHVKSKQKWEEESNTLLHELFHAIYHCYNLDKKSDEEKIVRGFANGMMEVMSRNPQLRKYFMKVWNAK